MPPGPTKSSEAPRILSDSCFLFNDLIDQLIDNGNMVAKRNSTKHYWKRSRFESTTDASYASESNASPATDRSSDATDVIYSSGDEHDVTKEALTTRSSTSNLGTCTGSIVEVNDFDSKTSQAHGSIPLTTSQPGVTRGTPQRDTYRTLCSIIDGDLSDSERRESLYRSTSVERRKPNLCVPALANALGYKVPPPHPMTPPSTTATPDYRAEPMWREKKRELMRELTRAVKRRQ